MNKENQITLLGEAKLTAIEKTVNSLKNYNGNIQIMIELKHKIATIERRLSDTISNKKSTRKYKNGAIATDIEDGYERLFTYELNKTDELKEDEILFLYDKKQNRIAWDFNDKRYYSENIGDNVCVAHKNATILILIEDILYGYTLNGKLKFKRTAPEGYIFQHFGYNPIIGLSIICEEINHKSWSEWYFELNWDSGEMIKYDVAR